MKIARADQRWQVLAFGRVVHDCLESLALEEGYRVTSVCARLEICDKHFRELFERDVGLTPKEWMSWERMVVSRRLLCWGFEPDEIAGRLGFADTNSFRREFRQVHGLTPLRFREVRYGTR